MKKILYAGIDVGSTTTKLVVTEKRTGDILYSSYRRHEAVQSKSVRDCLETLDRRFGRDEIHLALTGSGSKTLAERLNLPYIQETVANSIAVRRLYGDMGTAIELGGQDAKIIFFQKDARTGALNVADMRMNGSCAGGTGAFLDEMASVLKIPVEQLNEYAKRGKAVYDISGRCGVYAKTDIQPLLNQGIAREDLALSSFHAVAKQTIGGLAQGLEIRGPVIFEGGPLNFNPVLVDVFAKRLELDEGEIIRPENAKIMMAYGAALSIGEMFGEGAGIRPGRLIQRLEQLEQEKRSQPEEGTAPFFKEEQEKAAFLARVHSPEPERKPKGEEAAGGTVKAYLGIDSGSTTTKFVLLDEKENILDHFYASNGGDPLEVARTALLSLRDRYRKKGVKLEILGAGATGYGELMFQKAFSTEYHVVETVAHARAAAKYVPEATFILDIGGQDMKAIWLDRGIITNIVVNEACSSGCGSFLENFASSLGIRVEEIAEKAFASRSPAALGSRCTVFMNSSIVTAQRSGKQPEDIMAGLCRSIIENVFTKVIRISNAESLGDKIVVQGGTFQNDAVLRAMEQYLGREVLRPPYPGIMGAIGAALLTKEAMEKAEERGEKAKRTFIGLDALETFTWTQEVNAPCPFCGNHCKRTVLRFPNGNSWVTNNRCERGEVLGDPKDQEVQRQAREKLQKANGTANLFKVREKLLFQEYPIREDAPARKEVIGIPCVLSFWDTAPFWTTFFRSLGFQVKLSDPSTRAMYESGLYAVTSDTVCFPAKLVHGHLRNLAKHKVDRIFMSSVATVHSENRESTSESMCAVVKGYPLVIKNSDSPKKRWGIPFDAPLFYWYEKKDRDRQLMDYMRETWQIPGEDTMQAIRYADRAYRSFQSTLLEEGKKVLEQLQGTEKFAVVLASRPYQNDGLVNHHLPELFVSMGIPVLTVDSLPDAQKVDLSRSTLDIVNNYHARMLTAAIQAARSENLEYVQIVSFGCGHDAYLSDEITRLMGEISGKTPLVLKVDESDIQGPLRIRVRSFLETLRLRREEHAHFLARELPDPYPVKFTAACKKGKTVLVPNTSHAFSRIMAAAMAGQGLRTVPLEIGREEAISYGKQYVHNDICFPAQVVIGEALAALKSGAYDPDQTAIAMAKYVGDCRLTHYSKLLRKALDDAGFAQVPILTNDDQDSHNLHPGFKMNLLTSARIAFALPMIDALEGLLRKIRPYETEKGSADQAFEEAMDALVQGLEQGGILGARRGFSLGIERMKAVSWDRSRQKPTVLIVGEYLLNFHPGANREIERYLEQNGFEVIEAHMTDVIQKTYFAKDSQIREYHLTRPWKEKAWQRLANEIFELAHETADRIAKAHPLYTPPSRLPELVKESDAIIPHTFDTGEGVLIPAEILHHAKEGCRAFVILQPFGCLPNHIVGRGVAKKLKELYPDAQILPLDYDPDVSFANLENRLQMLIMNAKTARRQEEKGAAAYPKGRSVLQGHGTDAVSA